jgi:hypothetical protein
MPLAMNFDRNNPYRFAYRLDAEAMVYRAQALLALHNNDPIAADDAFRRAHVLLHVAGWAAMRPEMGKQLCGEQEIYDID